MEKMAEGSQELIFFLRVEGLIKQQTQLYTVKESVNDLAAVLK